MHPALIKAIAAEHIRDMQAEAGRRRRHRPSQGGRGGTDRRVPHAAQSHSQARCPST